MPAIHIAVHPLPRTVEELHERLDNARFSSQTKLWTLRSKESKPELNVILSPFLLFV